MDKGENVLLPGVLFLKAFKQLAPYVAQCRPNVTGKENPLPFFLIFFHYGSHKTNLSALFWRQYYCALAKPMGKELREPYQ